MESSLLRSNKKKEYYDPFASPPSLQKAQMHGKSCAVGRDKSQEQEISICPCCDNIVQKYEIPLNCNDEDLLFLGVGYSLYFKLARYFALIIFLIFLVSGSGYYLLVTLKCISNCIYFFGIPIINLQISATDSLRLTDVVNMVASFGIFICVLYVKTKIKEDVKQLQEKVVSLDQYTILLQNLPEEIQQKALLQWCFKQFNERPVSINFAYNLNELIQAYSCRQSLTIKLNKIELAKLKQDSYINLDSANETLKECQIRQLKEKITAYDNLLDLYRQQKVACHKIGTAFVTFQNQSTVVKILQKYQNSLIKTNGILSIFKQSLRYQGRSIIVSRAPQPKEVIWQNLQYSCLRSYFVQIVFILLMIGILYLSFRFQYLVVELAYKLRRKSTNSGETLAFIEALGMSLLVVAVNSIVRLLIKLFTYIKKYYSYSSYHSSFCFYYSASYILNTCFMIYIVHSNSVAREVKPFQQQNILIYDIHLIMFANAFSQPLYKIIDPEMWFRVLRRKYLKYLSENRKNPYTQSYVNVAWQGYQIQVADNYQYIFRILIITTWFAHSAPLGVIFSLLGLFLDYWICKYMLLKYYKRPQNISKQLGIPMIISLELLPLIYICGVLQFTYKVSDSSNIFMFIIQFFKYGVTVLVILICILGYLAIYKPNQFSIHDIKYEEIEGFLGYDYESENPISKFKGQMNYSYGVLKYEKKVSEEDLIKQILNFNQKSKSKQQAILKIKRRNLRKAETLQKSQQYKSPELDEKKYSTSSDTSNKRSQSFQ